MNDGRDRHRTLAGVADALLVFFPALALAQMVSLPHIALAGEFASASARAGFLPWTSYAQFALCALGVWAAFFLGHRRGTPIVAWIATPPRTTLPASLAARTLLWTLAAAALTVYFVNVTSVTLDAPLRDGFHEGEYLGFIPALASGNAVLASAFTVHGPGVDFLPGWIAGRIAHPDSGIVAARFAYAGLRAVATVAAMLVLLAFARLLAPAASRTRWIAFSALAFMIVATALQVGSWPDVPAFHKTVNARDAVFMLQVFAALAFALARKSGRHPVVTLTIAAISGASLPWAIMYSYDRGLYGAAFLLFASVAFCVCGRRWARDWLGGLAAGAAIGGATLYAAFGAQGIGAALEQVAFWVRHGRALWSYAGVESTPHSWAGALLAGWLLALALAVARIVRAIGAAATLRDAIRGEIGVIILAAASIATLRTAVERGDVAHLAWGVTLGWIILSVFAAGFLLDMMQPGDASPAAPLAMVAISALLGWNLALLNPVAAYERVTGHYVGALQKNDSKMLSAELSSAVGAIRDDVRSSACFYTLTNEGTWYYLLRKPSCSRFYQVTNARPESAQREVVAALAASTPAIVLFESGAWSSHAVDGVSPFNANPEVLRYVLTHYVPDKLVGDNWFWRRSEVPPQFSDTKSGALLDAPAAGNRARDVALQGTYAADMSMLPPKALFVTEGTKVNTPIWAGRPKPEEHAQGRWSAVVPTYALAPGRHRIRVWALHESGAPMIQLGTDVELDVK